jgi:hypothetical protein
VTTFRLSAHRRLVADPRRGRLLLQLAYVATADADALWDAHAWPPVLWTELSDEQRAEIEGLRALGDELAAEAARLGVRGGTDEAFRDVLAWAAPRIEAAVEREHLVWEVARALEEGAVLEAGDVEAAQIGSARSGAPLFAAYRDGEPLTSVLSADAAAAAFCGERGAGEEAARAALEAWEQKEEERAA